MKKIITTLCLLASGLTLQAASVSINNHSFENGAGVPAPGNWNNNTPADWNAYGSKGMQADATPPAGTDGAAFGFLQGGATGNLNGGSFTQDIATAVGGTINPGDVFTLTLAAVNQNASPSFDFDIRDNADPSLGSSLIGGTQQSGAVAGGTWADYVVMGTVDTASSNVFLVINTNGGQVRVDNVRLDIEPVPEPSSAALLGLGGLALILRRRK
ncbi:MAG: PEP-CTERM sorting domain-containing protein [Akkermansiaceae bacterium]